MKLLLGALAYLSVVAAVTAAAFVGLSSVERNAPADAPVLARGADEPGTKPARALDSVTVDADRVPVWIAPTAKYTYTPVPIEHKTKPGPLIGQEAKAAMGRSRDSSRQDGRRAIERALGETRSDGGRALGFARSRENDPFFRD